MRGEGRIEEREAAFEESQRGGTQHGGAQEGGAQRGGAQRGGTILSREWLHAR